MVVCTFPLEPSSGDALIEQEERRAATVERRLMRVGGEEGRELLHKEIVPPSFRKGSIHPDAPLRAESRKSSIDS